MGKKVKLVQIDPKKLKRGDQFIMTKSALACGVTAVYLGKTDFSGESHRHEFQTYFPSKDGGVPVPSGHLSLDEARDFDPASEPVFGLTKIDSKHPAWVKNPDTGMGNFLDALNELAGIEAKEGEAAFDGARMAKVMMKHLPKW